MTEVKLNVTAVMGIAVKMKQTADSFTSNQNSLNSQVQKLNNSWTGTAGEAMQSELNEIKQYAKNLQEAMYALAEFVKNVVDKIVDWDTFFANYYKRVEAESTPGTSSPESRRIKLDSSMFDDKGRYAYDYIEINGKRVYAYADKRLYDEYWSKGLSYTGVKEAANPPYGNCADLITRFYKDVYGLNIANLFGDNQHHPSGGVVQTGNPKVGDIVKFQGHWALIKQVNSDGTYTLMEQQNVDTSKGVQIAVNRVINKGDALAFYTVP